MCGTGRCEATGLVSGVESDQLHISRCRYVRGVFCKSPCLRYLDDDRLKICCKGAGKPYSVCHSTALCGKYPGMSREIKKENALEVSVCTDIAQPEQTSTVTWNVYFTSGSRENAGWIIAVVAESCNERPRNPGFARWLPGVWVLLRLSKWLPGCGCYWDLASGYRAVGVTET